MNFQERIYHLHAIIHLAVGQVLPVKCRPSFLAAARLAPPQSSMKASMVICPRPVGPRPDLHVAGVDPLPEPMQDTPPLALSLRQALHGLTSRVFDR